MIPFQFRTFLRLLTTRGPMVAKGWNGKLRRLAFFVLFPLFELVNTTLLSLDHLFFRFTEIKVQAPIFIISSPRSGSTLLHRIMVRDGERFTAFRLWQAIFPNLLTQAPVRWLGRLDANRGGRLRARFEALEDRRLSRTDRYHKIRLTEAEEDEVLLLHACASELLGNVFPIPEIWKEYRNFDTLPEGRREALMGFYRACVQRHLLLEGTGRTFLSKNPPFCHKVGALNETFPDARFVLLVRNPVESICSLLSMLAAFRSTQGIASATLEHPSRDDGALGFALDCYTNALRALDALPPERYLIIRYEDLVASPKATVERIYADFGLTITPAFHETLVAEEAKSKAYQSRHTYTPEQFGLTHAEIERMASSVYERIGSPHHAA